MSEKPSGKIYLTDSERQEIQKNGCKHIGFLNPDEVPCRNCEETALDCTCSSCVIWCPKCGKERSISCRLVRLAYEEKQDAASQQVNQGAKDEKKRRFKLF